MSEHTESIRRRLLEGLEEKCVKHPKYRIIFAPGCDCKKCWQLYTIKQGLRALEDLGRMGQA